MISGSEGRFGSRQEFVLQWNNSQDAIPYPIVRALNFNDSVKKRQRAPIILTPRHPLFTSAACGFLIFLVGGVRTRSSYR